MRSLRDSPACQEEKTLPLPEVFFYFLEGFFFFGLHIVQKTSPVQEWLDGGQDLWNFISWVGRGQQEEEENLIISFLK